MDSKKLFEQYLSSHYTDTEQIDFANQATVQAHLRKTAQPLARNLLPFFQKHVRSGANIVDLGCGYGTFLQFARDAGYETVTGVDISIEETKLCKQLFPELAIIQSEITDYLRTNTNSADVFYLSHVLEHVPKTELFEFMAAVRRALVAHGFLVIVVPNSAAYFNAAANRYGDLTHELGFSDLSLRQLLWNAGFRRVSIRNFYGAANPLLELPRSVARTGFELFLQLLGYDKQIIYTPSLLAIVRNEPTEKM